MYMPVVYHLTEMERLSRKCMIILCLLTILFLYFVSNDSGIFISQSKQSVAYYRISKILASKNNQTSKQDQDTLTTSLPVKEQKKVDHFIMTKIEKTGSSTLFSMLGRFTINNKLNVLVQRKFHHISWLKPKGQEWDIGPNNTDRADVLINHARYNKKIFDKHMVSDYKLIVPVREPVSWMKSAVKFFHELKVINTQSAEEVIFNDKLMYLRRNHGGVLSRFHLVQLQWLGFDYSKRENLSAIQDYISYIIPKIDIPILKDQFDASLVIMKKRFHWDYNDIFYQSKVVTHSESKKISDRAIDRLLSPSMNLGEHLLYEAVNKTWWNQPEVREPGFWDEVEYFKTLNSQVRTLCQQIKRSRQPSIIQSTRYHTELNITLSFCSLLTLSNCNMIQNTIRYALGTNDFGWRCK